MLDENSVIERGTPDAWKKFTSSLPENVSLNHFKNKDTQVGHNRKPYYFQQCRYAIYDVEMSIDLGAGLPPGTRTKVRNNPFGD